MKLLLSNDDGYKAPGINTLASALSSHGHEVYIVAPMTEKSGASASFSMQRETALLKLSERVYALDANPVNCVIAACRGLFPDIQFDAVLTGINRGPNIGTDVMYSGTCGAARQAAVYGYPAIALSMTYTDLNYSKLEKEGDRLKYGSLADFTAKNLEKLIALCKKFRHLEEEGGASYFININAPSADSFKGAGFATLSHSLYGDTVEVVKDDDGSLHAISHGGKAPRYVGKGRTDWSLVKDGYVALSLLSTESQVNSQYRDGEF